MRINLKYLLSIFLLAMVAVRGPVKEHPEKPETDAIVSNEFRLAAKKAGEFEGQNKRLDVDPTDFLTALAKLKKERTIVKAKLQEENAKKLELEEEEREIESTMAVLEMTQEAFAKAETKDLRAEEGFATQPAPRPSAFQQWSATKNPAKVEPETAVPKISKLPQPVLAESASLVFIIPTLYKPIATQVNIEILVAGVAKSNGPKRFFIDNETKPAWYLAVMFNKFISNLGPLFIGYADAGLVLDNYGTATIGVKAPEPKLDPKLNRPFNSWKLM